MTNSSDDRKDLAVSQDAHPILPDCKKILVSREEFLKLLGLSLSGLMGLLIVAPSAVFMLNYLFVPSRHPWIKIGSVDSFKEGETIDVHFDDPDALSWEGVTRRLSTWLRREKNNVFTAFAINCTHLGCPVRWEAGADLFLCPCHGGVYYSNGDVAAGPPPMPLHRYPVRIANGQVEIQMRPILTEG